MVRSVFSSSFASIALATFVAVGVATSKISTAGQADHAHDKGMEMPKHHEKMPPQKTLQPAQGASVKILSPKPGDVIKGDSVALEFEMKKGKIGEHVHAYVDGQMAGMFKGNQGTLNGLKPGRHTLELRVSTADHKTELNAVDRVTFTTK